MQNQVESLEKNSLHIKEVFFLILLRWKVMDFLISFS